MIVKLPSELCGLVLLLRSIQITVHMRVVIDVISTCRLVVVLERRTLVHDLKTLELLRTLETPSNSKVKQQNFSKPACSDMPFTQRQVRDALLPESVMAACYKSPQAIVYS